MILALTLVSAACLAVSGANITARDIAKAVPAFTPADPSIAVGYAPAPGVERVIHRKPTLKFLRLAAFRRRRENSYFRVNI
jgi:hypothetical protein